MTSNKMCAILLGPLTGTNLDKQILGRAAESWETVKAVQPVEEEEEEFHKC